MKLPEIKNKKEHYLQELSRLELRMAEVKKKISVLEDREQEYTDAERLEAEWKENYGLPDPLSIRILKDDVIIRYYRLIDIEREVDKFTWNSIHGPTLTLSGLSNEEKRGIVVGVRRLCSGLFTLVGVMSKHRIESSCTLGRCSQKPLFLYSGKRHKYYGETCVSLIPGVPREPEYVDSTRKHMCDLIDNLPAEPSVNQQETYSAPHILNTESNQAVSQKT